MCLNGFEVNRMKVKKLMLIIVWIVRIMVCMLIGMVFLKKVISRLNSVRMSIYSSMEFL